MKFVQLFHHWYGSSCCLIDFILVNSFVKEFHFLEVLLCLKNDMLYILDIYLLDLFRQQAEESLAIGKGHRDINGQS